MAPVLGRVRAAHSLLMRYEVDPDSSGLKAPVLLKLTHHLEQLSWHIDVFVPQPAHSSQSVAP